MRIVQCGLTAEFSGDQRESAGMMGSASYQRRLFEENEMSKLSHSNDETMVKIEQANKARRNEMEAITHDEWYAAQNRIGQLEAALEAIIKEATTTVDGHVYVPSGYGEVVRLAREALKERAGYVAGLVKAAYYDGYTDREREQRETPNV